MRTEIAKLHKRLETTFVYVTHDQTEAMTMGDRIVVMKDGYIQQIDTPQNLYNKPCNLFVAGFIGTPQMNFINGTVVKTDRGYAAEFAGCRIMLPESKNANLDGSAGKDVSSASDRRMLPWQTAVQTQLNCGLIWRSLWERKCICTVISAETK